MDLPESSASTLQLVLATESEITESSTLGSNNWKGPLETDDYLRREAHLRDQALTRDGGISHWVLVDAPAAPTGQGSRRILASCETIRKRALLARPGHPVREVITHGIGSVHCNPAYRGRGFARRMMLELAKKLDTWQQREGEKAEFTVLWSDIGKDFYAALGWKTYPSKYIALAPKSNFEHDIGFPRASLLVAEDIVELCTADEVNLRSDIVMPAWPGLAIRVALIPDAATMKWHHAREEFLAQVLLGKRPTAKGAMAETPDGRRVWCIWTRTFGASQNENVLNILRLFVGGGTNSDQPAVNGAAGNDQGHSAQALVRAIAAILQAAQVEASIWNMSSVQFWNPSPNLVLAAQYLDSSLEILDRHDESLSSLRWHGRPMPDGVKIDWVSNEKYGWC